MRGIILFLVILLIVVVVGASVVANKIGEAQSSAIRSDAAVRAANADHQRQLERNQDRRAEQEFLAKLPAIEAETAMMSQTWNTLGWLVPTVLALTFLPLGVSTGLGLTVGSAYLIIAFVVTRRKKMDLKARLVPLDRETGQYPLITQAVAGVLCIVNPNDDSVIVVNGNRQHPVPRKIAGSQYTQVSGTLAHKATKLKQPDTIGLVQPMMVDWNERKVLEK